ncbi:MAG: class I SAM-dependent methyltransferase [Myxococcota bacterium]
MPLALVGPEPDVTFYARQVAVHGSPVLVLGCANGRLAFALAARGHEVTGVDPAKVMIHSAEERRGRENGEVASRVRFIAADLRALRLSQRFPTVLAPKNALGLMGSREDLEAFLATVRHHLVSGGALVFDVTNPGARGRADVEREDVSEPLPEASRPLFAPHLRERKRRSDGREERAIRRLRLRQFEPVEIDTSLGEAGFVALERFGSFDGKPFDDDDALQIVIAEKSST